MYTSSRGTSEICVHTECIMPIDIQSRKRGTCLDQTKSSFWSGSTTLPFFITSEKAENDPTILVHAVGIFRRFGVNVQTSCSQIKLRAAGLSGFNGKIVILSHKLHFEPGGVSFRRRCSRVNSWYRLYVRLPPNGPKRNCSHCNERSPSCLPC